MRFEIHEAVVTAGLNELLTVVLSRHGKAVIQRFVALLHH